MNNKIKLELVWWVVTAVILTTLMFPIWKDFSTFPFHNTLIVFILCFITFTRYGFLLKHTFLAEWERGKIIFVLFTLAIVGLLAFQIQDFNVWYDNGDPDQLLRVSSSKHKGDLLTYIKSTFLFFAIGGMISAIFLGVRLLVSIWRLRNRGKV
jgi:hypothetical protein